MSTATPAAAGRELLPTQEAGAQPGALVPENNGILHPDRWTMFGRIANTVKGTKFVPKDIRNDASEIMACLLFGDSLGLHPSVSLTQVYMVDGRPSLSAALMVGKVREKGHRISRREVRDEKGAVVGVACLGERTDTGETDEFTFTLEMATRAGLMSKDNWKKYPEAMLWARACSQVCRMLFSDCFLGQAVYVPDEVEEFADDERRVNGGAATGGTAEEQADYGDDPYLEARLRAHFDALGTLPAKRVLLLEGVDQERRRGILEELEEAAAKAGIAVEVPEPELAGEVVAEEDGPDDPGPAEVERLWRESQQ